MHPPQTMRHNIQNNMMQPQDDQNQLLGQNQQNNQANHPKTPSKVRG